MPDDPRHRLLHAAAEVYAQHGWRGATTRRIAEAAGVNEVTLFRQFGSKDALLGTAVAELARVTEAASLPTVPACPEAELLAWSRAHHAATCTMRDLVRQLMSDAREHPEPAHCASDGVLAGFARLRQYVLALRRHGFMDGPAPVTPAEVRGAVTMFMGAVFADAMNRELMPAMFPLSAEASLRAYVRTFLRGIGVPVGTPVGTPVGMPSERSSVAVRTPE